MKLIIAGSRDLYPTPALIMGLLQMLDINPSEIVSGKAEGVDTCGEIYANNNKIPVIPFPADWDDISDERAVVKYRKDGKPYNAIAGHDRNRLMAEYADALLLIWDGKSSGSANMKSIMQKLNKPIYQVILK